MVVLSNIWKWVSEPTQPVEPSDHAPKLDEVDLAEDEYVFVRASSLRVLTWNICFQDLEVEARMAAIARVILDEKPDIIAFQEVTPQLERLLRDRRAFDNYTSVPAPYPSGNYYTLLFACKSNAKWLSGQREQFPHTRHARDHLKGLLEWNGIPVQVTNVHLESARLWNPDDLGSTERRRQVTQVIDDLLHDDDSLVMGDFNWIPSDGPFPELPPGAVDVWERQRPDDEGFTFDHICNGCVRSHYRGRPDKMLVRMGVLCPAHARLVGTDTIPNAQQSSGRPVLPSDHFGLLVDFGKPQIPAVEAGWIPIMEPEVEGYASQETITVKADEGWVCSVCAFNNRAKNSRCGGTGFLGCKAPNPLAPVVADQANDLEAQSSLGSNPVTWKCMSCGWTNRSLNIVCGGEHGNLGCKAKRPIVIQLDQSVHIPSAEAVCAKWTCGCGFVNHSSNNVCGGLNGPLGCKKPKLQFAAER